MRFLASVFILFGLAACASHQAEQKVAMDAWGDCVMNAVQRMDDGKTDPTSMAYGIAPMCASLYQDFSEAMVADMHTDKGQAHMRTLARQNELRMITSAILIHRSKAKR
jgi:hypothetical protein